METLENAEKRIRRDPEFGKFVRPVAIENYIKKSQLKPVVIKTKEEKKVVSKPSITAPVDPVPAKKLTEPSPAPVQAPKLPPPEPKPKPPGVNTDFLTGKPPVTTDPIKPNPIQVPKPVNPGSTSPIPEPKPTDAEPDKTRKDLLKNLFGAGLKK